MRFEAHLDGGSARYTVRPQVLGVADAQALVGFVVRREGRRPAVVSAPVVLTPLGERAVSTVLVGGRGATFVPVRLEVTVTGALAPRALDDLVIPRVAVPGADGVARATWFTDDPEVRAWTALDCEGGRGVVRSGEGAAFVTVEVAGRAPAAVACVARRGDGVGRAVRWRLSGA